MNKGTPSVRAAIWSMTSSGSVVRLAICSIKVVRSRRSSRLSASIVTWG